MAGGSEALDAGDRLYRLLALLAYLARVGEASISELAARFGMDDRTVVSELELAACCGLPPYTPDQLLELLVDGDRVFAHGLEALARPPRLTPDEGFALAAAVRALLVVPGSDESPLRSALAKLEAALGEANVAVEVVPARNVEQLRSASMSGELVEIEYLGRHEGEETRRTVTPVGVVVREGRFYLDAYCHLAEDWRRFQLDRISALRRTGEHDEVRRIPPPAFSSAKAFVGGPATRRARLCLTGRATLFVERFASSVPALLEDGRVVVEVEVADEDWLGRLLLRLGPDAEVLEPPALRGVAAQVARRTLARYESGLSDDEASEAPRRSSGSARTSSRSGSAGPTD